MKLMALNLGIIAAMGIAFAEPDAGTGAGTESVDPKPANTALTVLTDETKLETLSKHLPSVKIYDDYASALKAIESAAAATKNFYGLPLAATGEVNDEGELDTSIYEGMRVRVGTLSARVDVGKVKKNGVKAITIMPIPNLAQITADENGAEWLEKVIAKEMGLISYRNIRGAATQADLLAGMAKSPRTVAEYLAESKRAGAAGDTETFDALWRGMRDALKESMPALHKMLPSKVEVIKGIRSKAYALAEYPELESAKMGSVFVKLANAVIQNAKENTTDNKPAPMDHSAIDSWLEDRDTLVLSKRDSGPIDYSALDQMDFGGFGGSTGSAETGDSAV